MIPLATNIPGVYTVDWVSVSQVDGHRLTGSFTFDVGVVAGGSRRRQPRTRRRARSFPTSRSAR